MRSQGSIPAPLKPSSARSVASTVPDPLPATGEDMTHSEAGAIEPCHRRPVLMEHDELREQMIALGAAVLGAHDLMAKLVRRRDGLSPLKLLQNQMSLLSPLLSCCKTKPPFSVDESAAMQSELKRQIDSIRATLDTLRAEVERCWARRGAHRLDETSSDPGAPAAAASQASSYGPAEPFHYVRTTFQFLALTRELVDYLSAAQEGLDRLCP